MDMQLINKTYKSGNYEYNGTATSILDDDDVIQNIIKICSIKNKPFRIVISRYYSDHGNPECIEFYALYKQVHRNLQRVYFNIVYSAFNDLNIILDVLGKQESVKEVYINDRIYIQDKFNYQNKYKISGEIV